MRIEIPGFEYNCVIQARPRIIIFPESAVEDAQRQPGAVISSIFSADLSINFYRFCQLVCLKEFPCTLVFLGVCKLTLALGTVLFPEQILK
jgi:hypothetical protein